MRGDVRQIAIGLILLGTVGCHSGGDGAEESVTDSATQSASPATGDTESGTLGDSDTGSDSGTEPPDISPACDIVFDGVPTDLSMYDAGDRPAYDAGDASFSDIYDPEELPTFHLTLEDSAVAKLLESTEGYGALRPYVPGTFRYVSPDGEEVVVLEDVGIRLKGNYSFKALGEKASFKIKFSEFVDGQRFKGIRRLTLNNLYQDPSTVRERLAYLVYREAGLDASLCNHARVYLNGEFYGLFANVQSIDETFLEQHFDAPPDGNLYDTLLKPDGTGSVDLIAEDMAFFELETNEGEAEDWSDFTELMAVLAGPSETFYEDILPMVDMDAFLTFAAVQAVIADWDGYCGNMNNYKLYHELVRDRFLLIPWGTDQTFNMWGFHDNFLDYSIDHYRARSNNGILYDKCFNNVQCREDYLARVEEVVDLFEGLNLEGELNAILNQSTPSVYEDVRLRCLSHHSLAEFEESVAVVREFLRERPARVRAQLDAM